MFFAPLAILSVFQSFFESWSRAFRRVFGAREPAKASTPVGPDRNFKGAKYRLSHFDSVPLFTLDAILTPLSRFCQNSLLFLVQHCPVICKELQQRTSLFSPLDPPSLLEPLSSTDLHPLTVTCTQQFETLPERRAIWGHVPNADSGISASTSKQGPVWVESYIAHIRFVAS